MALFQNEDFAIWYLRTSYLHSVKDGVAERLVHVNNSVLNTPGFRAAGWSGETGHRTHSPPIPTTVNSEYFRSRPDLFRGDSQVDEDDEGGMVTGHHGTDTVGMGLSVKRRRKKEQIEDDDSSDLSDESDEDEETNQRAAQQIRFAKMPARDRADSSPIRNTAQNDIGGVAADPSRVAIDGRRRGGSLGAVEAVKARARADTTTSSDMSSENEVDPAYFRRRQVNARRPAKTRFLTDTVEEEDSRTMQLSGQLHDDSDADSVDSDLDSDLGDTVESASLLDTLDENRLPTSSPEIPDVGSIETQGLPGLPKRTRTFPLQELPPPRPISYIQPTSLLSKALNAQKAAPRNPVQKYASLSGKGSPNPLWIRIYAPFSEDPESPFEMPLAKTSKDGSPVIVAEAIGLSIWRYCEEKLEPKMKHNQLDVNKWSLRMVEDGEVDFDFPALQRTKPITDFTSNNNRGARARSRQRPFDEFALVEASDREYQLNMRETPGFSPKREDLESDTASQPPPTPTSINSPQTQPVGRAASRPNLLVAGQPFGSALNDRSVTPADKPTQITAQSTPRLGAMKTIRIRYFDLDVSSQTMTMEVSTDSYIAEILDHVCRRWNFDRAAFFLKVGGTNTVAPLDRTVEALGTRSDLELVRKRFGAGPTSLTGSPGSGSPNTPLTLDFPNMRKGKKGERMLHPLAQQQDLLTSASNFKKYYVTRKQLASFSQSNQRVLIFDGDFLHNMPSDTGKIFDSHTKTNSFAFADVLKCKVSTKHSKLIRLLVRRTAESKRYDFEARTAAEAQEIVDEITKEIRSTHGG